MKKELYKEGHFIKALETDIKALKNSDVIKIEFDMPKNEYTKLENSFDTNFRKLSDLLFKYTISGLGEDDYYGRVKEAVDSIIAFLNNNFDLKDNFYEDKLNLYRSYFKHYPRKLVNIFPEFRNLFEKITNAYVNLVTPSEFTSIIGLEEYGVPIGMYNDFHTNLDSARFYPKTKEYMIHCAELLLKDVDEMFTHEVFHYKEKNQKANENRIRKIVYLLKTKLDLDVD